MPAPAESNFGSVMGPLTCLFISEKAIAEKVKKSKKILIVSRKSMCKLLKL